MWCYFLTCLRRVGIALVVVIAVLVQAMNVCVAQDTTGRLTPGHNETRDATHRDTASALRSSSGPAFFAIRTQDGARVNARGAPELNRRVSVSFSDAALGAAVQSVAAHAGLEVTYSTELIPPDARVTMSADDVTVATALSRVLTNARLDVLVSPGGHLTLVAQTGPAVGGDAGDRALASGMPPVRTGRAADTAHAARLAGRVVQPDSTPVSGAAVGLVGTHDTATTDGAGHFTIRAAQSGPYLVTVRRLGFQPVRIAVSLSSRDEREVSVTLVRTVPLLPTVTTTAAERAAYRTVGFEQRLRAGNGYFMTYDQIVRKQATQFSDLFQNVPGLKVTRPRRQFGAAIRQSRGGPNCVSYVIDGNPQPILLEHSAEGTPLGPESPDHLFNVADIGAIEVYQASERPVQWGSDWCALVVIWTRTRLGLTPAKVTADDNAPRSSGPVIRGTPAVVADARCTLPASSDTMDFPIYATLHTDAPQRLSRKTWARYADSVLGVIQRWSVVPTDLALSTFGLPFVKDPDGSGEQPLEVSPALSTVIRFTLDSDGTLMQARVAASARSGGADTSLLALLARAASAHAFPSVPRGPDRPSSVDFDLLVSLTEPVEDLRSAVLGRLEVPVWTLSQKATLASDASGATPSGQGSAARTDSVSVEMVVDPDGRAVVSSARALTLSDHQRAAAQDDSGRARMAQSLEALHFDPARIGACRVPQLVIQPITVAADDSTRAP